MLQHLSFRLHRRARPVVCYKTRTIIFDYMSLTLATVVRVACAIPAAYRSLGGKAESDPKLLT